MIDRSLVLDFLVDLVIRTALVFSLFLLFTGHNAPGGGFVAGLVAGIALVLRFVAGGQPALRELMWAPPDAVMGLGLTLSLGTGIGGWMWGESFLHSVKVETTLPLLGVIKATSALPFDIGVFIVVFGLTAALLLSLGAGEENE
ncbi:hypothetical protein BH23ACT5_BH23ACT5_08760 [soil metagenome]